MRIQHNISPLNTHRNLMMNNTKDEALKTLFGSNYSEAAFKSEFKSNGVAFIEDVLLKGGIGSVAEVSGVDGMSNLLFNRATYDDDNFIPDTGREVDNIGFQYNWSSSTPYDDIYNNLSPYEMFSSKTIASNGEMKLQLGAYSGQTIKLTLPTATSHSLGLADIDVKNLPDYSLQAIDGAIEALSSERSKLGAIQNSLEHAHANITNTSENLTAAESRIRDVDVAKEMMNHTKQNILMQAAQSMLAQANGQPEGILQLLK